MESVATKHQHEIVHQEQAVIEVPSAGICLRRHIKLMVAVALAAATPLTLATIYCASVASKLDERVVKAEAQTALVLTLADRDLKEQRRIFEMLQKQLDRIEHQMDAHVGQKDLKTSNDSNPLASREKT